MDSYIKAKSVSTNPNDIKNLEGIGKELWHFLSVVYESHWNGLYMDNSNMSFRNKVKSKFNPQVPKISASNKKQGDSKIHLHFFSLSTHPNKNA